MDLQKLEEIKRIAIIAMFADDVLMDTLVLKGGNALDIAYKIANRSSIDLDFSMEHDFDSPENYFARISKSLEKSFLENSYRVFDIKIIQRPTIASPGTPDFWGGYDVTFKIIENDKFEQLQNSADELRKYAAIIAPGHKKIFNMQISKCEYCDHKTEFDLGGYTIFVYSPEMIVFEKLRSICQQMSQYKYRKNPSARARDFFDIFTVLNRFYDIDVTSADNLDLLKNIFIVKDVPLELIKYIKEYREFHRSDFSSVQDTVKSDVSLRDYDYYFDYVSVLSDALCKALGVV